MKKRIITTILTIILVTIMVGAAELLAESEIIFPEIAAMAIGGWVAPKQVWHTNRLRIVIMTGLLAVLGLLISAYLPLSLYLKLLIAFVIASAAFLLSATTFAPMISAMVLPILLGTTSWVYPLAAIILSLLIVLGQWGMEKGGIYTHYNYTPLPFPDKRQWLNYFKRIAVVAVLAAIVLGFNWRFCVAPPLLVAFTELSSPHSAARCCPLKVISLISGCALIGVVCRWLLCLELGLPLTLAAAVAILLMLLCEQWLRLYLPPAGAIGILSMLIPLNSLWLYPVEILVGSSLLTGSALLFFPVAKQKTA